MADKDLHTKVTGVTAFNTLIISSNGTYNGNILDLLEYESATFCFLSGPSLGADIEVTIQHDDDVDFATATTVPTDFIIGALPTYASGTTNTVKKFGYVGKKRYVRVNVIATNHSGATPISCIAVKGDARKDPN